MRLMPDTSRLPHALYRAAQVRALDRAAIEGYRIPGGELMERAGQATYALLREAWPQCRALTVLCGAGNNGGDGYVVARLAAAAGLQVRVLALKAPEDLHGDARDKAIAYRDAGGTIEPYQGLPARTELIVDALLGTGLEREVSGAWADAIRTANAHRAPILAVDIPSGLAADTGAVLGVAIEAAMTISFIGLKQGLFTGAGPGQCGRVHFSALQVPAAIYSQVIAAARRIDWASQGPGLTPRRRDAHKGDFGHVLVVGGSPGMSGAARLAGEAALRAGAGLVTLGTHPEHAPWLNLARPELMCRGIDDDVVTEELLSRATVVAIGPGLGQADWGRRLWQAALETARPLVVDADGLNLLAEAPQRREDWVLTPHPGEAGRLLGIPASAVQQDRFAALDALRRRYGGVIVLKGAGTLVAGPSHRPTAVCSDGNPGMASGGTGDALTGIIAALVGQVPDLEEAASLGVCLHAAAADLAALDGERGLLASDLIERLRATLNTGRPR